MKSFKTLLKEQSSDVEFLRNIIYEINMKKIVPNDSVLGALLTGSVARGDARIGSLGVMIDVTIVVRSRNDINVDEIFGRDEEPFIPKHCVSIQNKIGLGIDVIEENDLWKIREKEESSIFAMHESEILDDKGGVLKKWKQECFTISEDHIKERALQHYFRFDYLTNEYRFEKWSYRKAWIQIAQNFNEANECYCGFLYCINHMFVPRKDWLTYLTYDMEYKPQNHQEYMKKFYETQLNEEMMNEKYSIYQEIGSWMQRYIEEHNWL